METVADPLRAIARMRCRARSTQSWQSGSPPRGMRAGRHDRGRGWRGRAATVRGRPSVQPGSRSRGTTGRSSPIGRAGSRCRSRRPRGPEGPTGERIGTTNAPSDRGGPVRPFRVGEGERGHSDRAWATSQRARAGLAIKKRAGGAVSREALGADYVRGGAWGGAGRRGGAGGGQMGEDAPHGERVQAVAMTRSRSPQRGQARTSRTSTRRINTGQVQACVGSAARGLTSNSRALPSRAGRP